MKLTRRKLAAAVLAAPAAALAQSQPVSAADDLKAARDRLRANADALASVKLPMSAEPAFQFKA